VPTRPPVHNPLPRRAAVRHEPKPRETACKRGYGSRWRKLREAVARVRPAICVVCGYAGPSWQMHLDHKQAREKGGSDHPNNLQWLCGPGSPNNCHGKKTAAEDGAFGRPTK
jgi:5-methylcytosine-specific restriction protein A